MRELLIARISPTKVLEVFSRLENVCDVLVWTAGTGDRPRAVGVCVLVDYDKLPTSPVKGDVAAEVGCSDLALCEVCGIVAVAIVDGELQTHQSGQELCRKIDPYPQDAENP